MSKFAAPARASFASTTTVPVSRRASGIGRALRVVWQASLLAALWAAVDWIVRACALPLPAGVVGLAVLLSLLLSGRVAPAWVKDGANWLLTDMLLFFIPATVAAVRYGQLFRTEGWRLALVVLGGTAFVMCAVAISVDLAVRVERRFATARAKS